MTTTFPASSTSTTATAPPKPPTYPARPVNGGPLPLARPKRGPWAYEPKVNGWRALVHTPTLTMWNRRGERLSIESLFQPTLERLRDTPIEWLDCEAFERRHALGRGSLVILDAIVPGHYDARQTFIHKSLHDRFTSWPFLHIPPPDQSLLSFAYTFQSGDDPEISPETAWTRLQDVNRQLNAPVFEGLVAKRRDSHYPLQLRSASEETPTWVKHRWHF